MPKVLMILKNHLKPLNLVKLLPKLNKLHR